MQGIPCGSRVAGVEERPLCAKDTVGGKKQEPARRGESSLTRWLSRAKEGQEFAVGPFIRGNLSRRWASDINSTS